MLGSFFSKISLIFVMRTDNYQPTEYKETPKVALSRSQGQIVFELEEDNYFKL